jgi:hypothetical protein
MIKQLKEAFGHKHPIFYCADTLTLYVHRDDFASGKSKRLFDLFMSASDMMWHAVIVKVYEREEDIMWEVILPASDDEVNKSQ